jgi:hypothetical protein
LTRRRRAANTWVKLGWQSWMLGIEASSVIAARVMKMSAGGDASQREVQLMIAEKVEAALQLQTRLANLGLEAAPATAVATALRHYRKKVTANRQRLSR